MFTDYTRNTMALATLQYIVTVSHDGRHQGAAAFNKTKEGELGDLLAGRAWTIDGVTHADAALVPTERVVITRAEYEALRNKAFRLAGLEK